MPKRDRQLPISFESYFEHDCKESRQGDILDTAIKGTYWMSTLKRWWQNLFLLSQDDERCRKYYKSSYALKRDRAYQLSRHRCRIHPLSRFSKYWGYIKLVTSILIRLCMHRNSSVLYPSIPMPYPVIGIVLEFILLIDIWINFMSGYIDHEERKVILDVKMSCMHYCSTNFFLHVLSSLPFQTILLLRYRWEIDCKLCKSNSTVSWIKILGIFGYYRVVESTRLWTRERKSYVQTHCLRFLRIVTLAALARLQLLSFIDAINILLMIKKNKIDENSFLETILNAQMILPTSVFIAFELALLLKPFFVVTLKGDVGFRPLDQLLTMASLLVCGVFFVWSLMECYKLIHRIYYPEDELAKQKDMMMVVLRSKHIPTIMIEKVAEFYNYKASKANIINISNDLIQSLPQSLTNEIKLALNERYIRRIPYFSEWHSDIVEWLTLSAHEEFFMKGDIVINLNSHGEGLIVIKAGLLAVYSSDNVETEHLIDGDYFNEISLVTDCEVSACEVVAITHCQILLLKTDVFRTLMRKYPKLFYSMRAQLIRKYEDSTVGMWNQEQPSSEIVK